MKTTTIRKFLAIALAFVMVLLILPISALQASAAEENKVYILDATNDLEAMDAGAKADGETEKMGTDDYFTFHYSAKTKFDSSKKTFEDGYSGTQRISYGGNTSIGSTIKNAIEITTSGAATLKFWWVCGGDGREIAIYDAAGEIVTQTDTQGSVKNTMYISELTLDAAGTYYIGNDGGSNWHFKIEVTEAAGSIDEDPEQKPEENPEDKPNEDPEDKPEDLPQTGDAIFLTFALLAVSAAALAVLLRKKRAF